MYARLHRAADEALAAEPNPIAQIEAEGKLKSDPAKIRTEASLKDMPKMEALGFAYAAEGKKEYAEKARAFILAWARQNHSVGDPIDDTGLESLLVAYDLTADTFSAADRNTADAYLREVAAKELETAKKHANNHYNNWHSHRLKILGLIAFVLKDKSLIEQTSAAFKEQIDHNLNPDGSSSDFHVRDALHYHIYDLEPLLALAIASRNNKIDLYNYQSPKGGSLAKGIAFLLPFAQGTQTHAEFVHSSVQFDRQRAESGDKAYQAGSPFQPKTAVGVLQLAELFDPTLLALEIKLAKPDAKLYPTWPSVLNAARR